MKGKIMLEESIEITSVRLDLVQNMHLREEGFVEEHLGLCWKTFWLTKESLSITWRR